MSLQEQVVLPMHFLSVVHYSTVQVQLHRVPTVDDVVKLVDPNPLILFTNLPSPALSFRITSKREHIKLPCSLRLLGLNVSVKN